MQKKKFGKNMLARFDHYLRYLCLKRKWGWNEKAFFSEKKFFGVKFFLSRAKSKVQVIVFRCFDLPLSIRETVGVDNDGDVTFVSDDVRANDATSVRRFVDGDTKSSRCQSKD